MPSRPLGSDVVVMVKAEAMVSVRLTGLLSAGVLESVTVNMRGVALAVAAGVPLRTPVEEFNARPAGRDPDDRVQV